MSQFSNPRKTYPHIPKQTYDHQPMRYMQIRDDGSYTTITRVEFFSLMGKQNFQTILGGLVHKPAAIPASASSSRR